MFLASSPLPSVIVISNDNNQNEIFVYSINGSLIIRQIEQENINSPIILKDLNSNEYLAYISGNSIFIRSIPNLFLQVNIEDLINIYTICTSEDKKKLYALNHSGSEIYIIRGELKKMAMKKDGE